MARLKRVCPACNENFVRGSMCATGHPPVEPVEAIEKYLVTGPEWAALTPAEKAECLAADLSGERDGCAGPWYLSAMHDAFLFRVNSGEAPDVLKRFPRQPFDAFD